MRRAFAIFAATALVLVFGTSSTAAPPREMVIHASSAGSHLRLTVEGSHVLVNGRLAGVAPTGCRITRGLSAAACPISEGSSIVLRMGPANDKITVMDPLPIPLIAHLGSGSDKLIGNDEPDTCYAEGTRRNRCIGGGGDDVCISGPVNTDCVGGPGDDYCRTSVGSDGCWGGPGDDFCAMGHGQDGCHGDAGNDRLFGGKAGDQLYGGRGRDHCDSGPGVGGVRSCETGPRNS